MRGSKVRVSWGRERMGCLWLEGYLEEYVKLKELVIEFNTTLLSKFTVL